MYTTIEFIIDVLYILVQSSVVLGTSYLTLKIVRYFISKRFRDSPDLDFNEDDSTDTFDGY